jgi:hypothetical protein
MVSFTSFVTYAVVAIAAVQALPNPVAEAEASVSNPSFTVISPRKKKQLIYGI